jgi:3',5'-cyclic AMP phosphodiesterase CpdA
MTKRRDFLRAVAALPLTKLWAADSLDTQPYFFIVLADPQFGFWNANDFPQEQARCEFLVSEINRLRPRFVVVCGDLVNRTLNQKEADAYRTIFGKIRPDVHLYNVPGHHDINDDPPPNADTYAFYEKNFGKLYYSFREGMLYGIVLDSTSLKHPKSDEARTHAETEKQWFHEELAKGRASGAKHLVVFQHHPWFLWTDGDTETYFNMPLSIRQEMIPWLLEYGVRYTFSGHMHANRVVRYQNKIEFVTSGSVTSPNFGSKNGLRIVMVHADRLEHRYFTLGTIPRMVDIEAGFPEVEPL